MQAVWDGGIVSTRDVHQRLLRSRAIAYTTVMTVMANLTRKGLLERHLEARAYLYRATMTREELTRSRVAEIVGTLLDRFAEPTISFLIGRLDRIDEATLAELEANITKLRQRRTANRQRSIRQRQTLKEDGR